MNKNSDPGLDDRTTRVLMVISAADRWTLNDGTVHPSGYWGEEVAEPHRVFSEAGYRTTIAAPGGVAPTLDKLSLGLAGGSPRRRHRVEHYLARISDQLAQPRSLQEVDQVDYDLIFYPGGHGPMEDLAYDETSGALLTARLASGRPLALLCHAPAALLAAKNADGSWPFAGYKMTALSNTEERFNSFAKKAPWLLEDKLRDYGAEYSKGILPLRPHIVADRNLHTGQNPQSSEKLALHLTGILSNQKRT